MELTWKSVILLLVFSMVFTAYFTVRTHPNEPMHSQTVHEQQRRVLLDKPLQFLSSFLPHIVSNDKPIEFLSDAHIDLHNSGTQSTAASLKPQGTATGKVATNPANLRKETPTVEEKKPIQFFDVARHQKEAAAAAAQTSSSPKSKANTDKSTTTKGEEKKALEFLDVSGHQKAAQKAPSKLTSTSITFKSDKEDEQKSSKAKAKKPAAKKDEYIDIHKEIAFVNPHPFMSPRNGTDISPQHQMTLLKCPKQSTCIVPELQLAKKLKVYLCKHPTKHGVRFYYIAREGLLLHPNVELLTEERIGEADFIVYLPGSSPWHLTECTDPSYMSRLIVLDEFDGHQLISPTVTPEEYTLRYGGRNKPWYFMYYKRSFVRRLDGDFKRYPHFQQPDVYPMTYAIAEAYIPEHFNLQRDIDILCTLRGTKAMTTRMRTQTWVAEYGTLNNIKNIVTSQVNTATRTTVSMAYFQQMFNSRIIVTVNPADWEGDFRLWESLCTGALIFVDPLYVPHPYPLQGGEHVVFFDNNNRTDLFTKLDYYRANPLEARRVAVNGYLFAMKYHRTVNMMDYILRSAHLKQTTVHKVTPLPHYIYTAQYLNYEAAAQEKMIIQCKSPGHYGPVPSDSHFIDIAHTGNTVQRLTCGAPTATAAAAKGKAPVRNIKFGASRS